MKLKKIASLALAGIMAVSMLTACGKSANNGNNGEGDGENNGTAAGYSAMLAEAVSDKVKKMDYVTFQDDAKVGEALEDVLSSVGSGNIALNSLLAGTVTPVEKSSATAKSDIADDFTNALKLNDFGSKWMFSSNKWMNDTRKVGNIFYVDATVDMEKAMKQVAEQLKDQLESLEEKGTAGQLSYNFHYTVSVSVVNKSVDTIDWYHGSVNYIAVTVTRTGTAA